MKKVISITIGQVVFEIVDDAYEELSVYLDSIRKHFSKDKDKEEIMEDIETSIAEKFLKRRKKREAAITIADVEGVVKQMGTVKDFEKEEKGKERAKEEERGEENGKKLYRDSDDVIVAGVSSGLAAYLGLETVLVRLIFFVSTFFGGVGVIAYIILWIVVPIAETKTQKFEMSGKRVTLKQIEKSVKEGVERLKKKDFKHVEKGLNGFFKAFGKVVLGFLKVIGGIVGLSFVIAGIAGITALSFSLAWVIMGVVIPNTGVLVSDFVMIEGALYWIFVGALYVVMLVPFLFLLLMGMSLLQRKSTIGAFSLISLLSIWFFAIGLTAAFIYPQMDLIETKIEEIGEIDKEPISVLWGIDY